MPQNRCLAIQKSAWYCGMRIQVQLEQLDRFSLPCMGKEEGPFLEWCDLSQLFISYQSGDKSPHSKLPYTESPTDLERLANQFNPQVGITCITQVSSLTYWKRNLSDWLPLLEIIFDERTMERSGANLGQHRFGGNYGDQEKSAHC